MQKTKWFITLISFFFAVLMTIEARQVTPTERAEAFVEAFNSADEEVMFQFIQAHYHSDDPEKSSRFSGALAAIYRDMRGLRVNKIKEITDNGQVVSVHIICLVKTGTEYLPPAP